MTEVSKLLEKITDLIVIIIRIVGLMAGCMFLIFVRIYRISLFFQSVHLGSEVACGDSKGISN